MSTACSYNSAIRIKYISYWFMSCFFLVFPSVWIYTVSPGVLLCSLAERMNGLPPPFTFYLAFWRMWLSLCSCEAPLGFLSHPALVRLGDGAEMGIPQQCWKCFWVCCPTLSIPLRPRSLFFHLLSEFGPCAGSAGLDRGWERSLSSAPAPPALWLTLEVSLGWQIHSVQNPPLVLFIINMGCLFHSFQSTFSPWHLLGIVRWTH